MRLTNLLLTTLLLFVSVFARSQKSNEFTVLQWNVWQEGTMVPGGYDAIVNEIVRLKPDFVTFSEVRNYNKTNFTARVCASLKEKGLSYYSFYNRLADCFPRKRRSWKHLPSDEFRQWA